MGWIDLREFRFWANKVLPLVYDDSLSYYEVLCKVVDYINKMIENEAFLYEEYSELLETTQELERLYKILNKDLRASIVELNQRCTKLEDDMEYTKSFLMEYVDNIRDGLENQLNHLTQTYNSLYALTTSLAAQIESGDVITLQKSKAYTDSEIIKLKKQLAINISTIFVIDPMDGQLKNIQTVINELFEWISFAAFTCWEFDRRGYTCEYLDSLGYTCTEYDVYGKFIFIFGTDYVTSDMIADFVKREELEHYALKTDLEPYALKRDLIIYNPVNGLRNTIQQVVDTLISFHACGNNCITLDGLDYTVNQYQALKFTAYEFDFQGIVKKCGLYTNPVTGKKNDLQRILNDIAHIYTMNVTAKQFDDAEVDCDTWDGYNISAYEWDFYGLNIWSQLGNISVSVGLTVDDYNNLVVGQYGIIYYVPTA